MMGYKAEKEALLKLYFAHRITSAELHKELELIDSLEHGERVFAIAALGLIGFALSVTYVLFLR